MPFLQYYLFIYLAPQLWQFLILTFYVYFLVKSLLTKFYKLEILIEELT